MKKCDPQQKSEYTAQRLYSYGIFMLGRREYGRAELKEKMLRHSKNIEDIESVLTKLVNENYLSDQRAIVSIINQYKNKESPYKLNSRLLNKGFSRDDVDLALTDLNATAPETLILELLNKKFKIEDIDLKNDQQKKNKIIRFLVSRGFKYNDIKKALSMKNDNY